MEKARRDGGDADMSELRVLMVIQASKYEIVVKTPHIMRLFRHFGMMDTWSIPASDARMLGEYLIALSESKVGDITTSEWSE